LIRISADGQKVEVLATGFRNPDGLGLCADGSITVPCSEGDWTPASMVCLVKPTTSNLAAGTVPPHYGHGGPKNGKPPELPFVYLPRGLDNSSGGQVEVPEGRWGPLAGQLIHFSYGTGSHFLLLKDEVAGQSQGAVVPLVGEFRSGSHRGRFHPKDGQLYVAGMGGWGHYTPDDGCLHRVRYTGEAAQFPVGFHVHENGVVIKFCNNVDPQKLADVRKHFAQAWNYRYSPGYGSPELATTHFGIAGHDVLEVSAVHLIDEKTVFVELPDLQPVNQLHLLLEVDGGKPQELFITVHRLDKPFTAFKGYKPVAKLIAAHPLEMDLKLLGKRLENPFAKKRMTTEVLNISAAQNLGYSTPTIKATAGTTVALTLKNPDVVPHNWVLIKPGQLAKVGDLSNKLIADPEAVFRHYVPVSDDVLAYTDMVSPGESFTIYMDVPKEKGRYPFLCTFPGHWMAMNGELVVE
jgi:azurin